jgi:hypothetical protein
MLKRTHARLLKELESKHRQELIRLRSEALTERNSLRRENDKLASMTTNVRLERRHYDPQLFYLTIKFPMSDWLDERWAEYMGHDIAHRLIDGIHKYGKENLYKAFEHEAKP